MTWNIAIAAATLAVSGLQAYAQNQNARAQASLGQQAAALRREQLAIERDTVAVQAREQEAERQRRADLGESTLRATAAAFGLDPWASGSLDALAGENRRQVMGDISSIRLLGAARQRQLFLADRGAAMEGDAYATADRMAWIRPTATLLGAGLSVYQTWPASTPDASGNAATMYRGLTAGQRGAVEPLTGRARGPV